jgi:hypothetical protein
VKRNRLYEAFFVAFCEGIASTISALLYPNNFLAAGIICGISAVLSILIFEFVIAKNKVVKNTSSPSATPSNKQTFKNSWDDDDDKVSRQCFFIFLAVGTAVGLFLSFNLTAIDKSFEKSRPSLIICSASWILLSCGIAWLWSTMISGIISDTTEFTKKNNAFYWTTQRKRLVPVLLIAAFISGYLIYKNVNTALVTYLFFVITPFAMFNYFED